MHRLRAGALACVDDFVGVEITLRGRRCADTHRLIGARDMQRITVGIGEHRHRGDTHPPRGANHPASDFSAIGDEDFGEHESFKLAAR